MKTCVIIPVYNHEQAISSVIEKLKVFSLPCIVVNDGSSLACSSVLDELAAREPAWLTLINRPGNSGKGAAVMDGFRHALNRGFSHAIQLDADGQHDVAAVPRFLEQSGNDPDALVLGQPVFDESAPKSRLYGRRITNFWIAVNTLSLALADGMCGFRLYPLRGVERLLNSVSISPRMAFDIDIAVRLYWQGAPVINLPVSVAYPVDGVSHFRLFEDNFDISRTHARLFFGMLRRSPRLLMRYWR